ncbi:MAG: DUF3048 domain-containing protein, partial [Actinomycetota bacterium]
MSRLSAVPPAHRHIAVGRRRSTVLSTVRPVSVAVVAALALAACGGGVDDDDALAFTDSSTTTVTVANSSTTTEPGGSSTTEQSPTTTEAVDRQTTPTTVGSDLPPVQTIAVDPGGDPDGIYAGRIGELSLDGVVVPGVISPPLPTDGIAPLTGLPAPDLPIRPAAVVKIDNGPGASPQTGLGAADIVIEEEVEGGVTRFAAVFHSNPSLVGPVRSGRTTDLPLLSGLGDPLLIYSGANRITEGILRSNPDIQNRSHGAAPGGFWRESDRQAPSNLYSDTAPHWASSLGGPPPPQFHYRTPGEPVAGVADDVLTVTYGALAARWEWEDGRWLRWQRGQPHLGADGRQLSAANVVVIEAIKVDTGMT